MIILFITHTINSHYSWFIFICVHSCFVRHCHATPRLVIYCHVTNCRVSHCHVSHCHVKHCHATPCLVIYHHVTNCHFTRLFMSNSHNDASNTNINKIDNGSVILFLIHCSRLVENCITCIFVYLRLHS